MASTFKGRNWKIHIIFNYVPFTAIHGHFVSMTWKFHDLKLQTTFVILTYFSTDIYNGGTKSNKIKHMVAWRSKLLFITDKY